MSAGGDGGSGLGPPELPGAQPTAATPPILGQHRNSQTAQDGQPATAQSQTGQTHGTSTGAAKSATKRPARRGGKAVPDRPLRALFCLPLKNPVRKMCIDVIEWKYPFLQNFYFFPIVTGTRPGFILATFFPLFLAQSGFSDIRMYLGLGKNTREISSMRTVSRFDSALRILPRERENLRPVSNVFQIRS